MPDPTKKAETIAVPEGFDIDKALNTKGFLEFLGKHPDAAEFDMKNGEEVSKRFETFQKKESVKGGLKDLYVKHIQEEMGIKLSPEDLEAIEGEIETRAINSPEDVVARGTELAQFAEVTKSMTEAWNELNQLGYFEAEGNIEGLKKMIETVSAEKSSITLVKDYVGFFGNAHFLKDILTMPRPSLGMLKDINATRAQVETKYGTNDKKKLAGIEKNLEDTLAQYNERIAKMTEVAGRYTVAQEGFANLQKNLLGEMAGFKAFTGIVQRKAQGALDEMMAKGTLSSFDKAQAQLEKLKAAREKSETGVDPLEGMDEEMFQQMLDAAAEEKVKDHITEAVLNAKMGNNALSNLEKSLSTFITKENVGSKDAEESRQFVLDTISEIREELGDNEEARMKKVMLARVLVKLQK